MNRSRLPQLREKLPGCDDGDAKRLVELQQVFVATDQVPSASREPTSEEFVLVSSTAIMDE